MSHVVTNATESGRRKFSTGVYRANRYMSIQMREAEVSTDDIHTNSSLMAVYEENRKQRP